MPEHQPEIRVVALTPPGCHGRYSLECTALATQQVMLDIPEFGLWTIGDFCQTCADLVADRLRGAIPAVAVPPLGAVLRAQSGTHPLQAAVTQMLDQCKQPDV